MKIFVLEDDPLRIERAWELLEGHEVTLAKSVEEALKKWDPPYGLLLLDHDLGGEQMVDSENPNTGYQFIKAIADQIAGSVVVVHSFNPDGANQMYQVAMKGKVAGALIAPFGGKVFTKILGQLLPKKEEREEAQVGSVSGPAAGAGADRRC